MNGTTLCGGGKPRFNSRHCNVIYAFKNDIGTLDLTKIGALQYIFLFIGHGNLLLYTIHYMQCKENEKQ